MKRRRRLWLPGLALAISLLVFVQSGLVVFAQTPAGGEDEPAYAADPAAPADEEPRPDEQPPAAEEPPGDEDAPEDGEDVEEPPETPPDEAPDEGTPEEDEAAPEAGDDEADDDALLGTLSTELDANTVVVYTFTDFAAAVSGNNAYTTIYIGADITATGGATFNTTVNAGKADLLIDGCPPGSPAGTRFTYTDVDSDNYTNTIFINSAANKSVTVQNLNVVGRNFYGLVCCYNNSTYTPTITYKNVTYKGPQFIYNRFGTAVVTDSSFTIMKNGNLNSQEFAEVNRIEFNGNVTIDSRSTGDAVLWMSNAAPALVVRSGANVAVTTDNYFIYNDSAGTAVTIEDNASLAVTTATYGFTTATHTLASLSLGSGAALSMTQNGTASSNGALRIAGSLTVGSGARMDVQAKGGSPGILFTSAAAKATFTDPALVRILSTSASAFSFTSGATSTLSIVAGTLNLWPTASSFSPGTGPGAMWNKAGTGLLEVRASYSSDIAFDLTSNLSLTADPISALPGPLNFKMRTTQLVAFGACPLAVNTVASDSDAITGSAGAGAALTAVYTSATGLHTVTGTAGGDGAYTLALTDAPLNLSTVTVTSAWNGLYSVQAAVVLDAGALGIASVPAALDFGAVPISAQNTLVARRTSGFTVSVSDTRLLKLPWALQLGVDGPLTATVEGNPVVLPDALVFVTAGGDRILLDTAPLKVYTQPPELLTGSVNISWDDDEGVMLLLPAGQGRAGARYSATLHWYLVEAP